MISKAFFVLGNVRVSSPVEQEPIIFIKIKLLDNNISLQATLNYPQAFAVAAL
jgi:hypothetical protein